MSRPSPRPMWTLLPILTLALAASWSLAGQHNTGSAAALFKSPIQTPTAPTAATSTVTPTPDGLFRSILATPQYVASYRQHLPLVRRDFTPTPTPTPTATATPTPTPGPLKYGWKGVGVEVVAAPESYSDWYYDWGAIFPAEGLQAMTAAEILAGLEAGLQQSDKYVSMVACPSDVSIPMVKEFPDPATVADLARRFPGRVWLLFNEPDNRVNQDGCGWYIEYHYSYISTQNWTGLGDYIGRQYRLYYEAIKAADPTARVFSPALEYLPLPTLAELYPRAIPIWEGFLNYLYNTDSNKVWLDGIALHAYPNHHGTYHTGGSCQGVNGEIPAMWLDPICVEEALRDSYQYLQGVGNIRLHMTLGRPIWITETGVLYDTITHPNWSNELTRSTVRDDYQRPLVEWFQTVAAPLGQVTPQEPSNGCCMWFNALGWYISYRGIHQASSLLDAPSGNLTDLGLYWQAASCDRCVAPGFDTP